MAVATMTGKELAIERFARGHSAIEVAKVLGIHRSTISMYENGWRHLPEGFERRYLDALKRLDKEKSGAA